MYLYIYIYIHIKHLSKCRTFFIRFFILFPPKFSTNNIPDKKPSTHLKLVICCNVSLIGEMQGDMMHIKYKSRGANGLIR